MPLCLLASQLSAQQVDLQIREAGSRAPVAGAIVRLLGDRGVAAQGLTNEQGRIVLRAAAPGSYRIKVDRIGWSGFITPPVALAAGAAYQRELLMEARRVELPALEVRGRSRCDREGQGGPLAAARDQRSVRRGAGLDQERRVGRQVTSSLRLCVFASLRRAFARLRLCLLASLPPHFASLRLCVFPSLHAQTALCAPPGY